MKCLLPDCAFDASLLRDEHRKLSLGRRLLLNQQLIDVNRDIRRLTCEVDRHVQGVVDSSNMLKGAQHKFTQIRNELGFSDEMEPS